MVRRALTKANGGYVEAPEGSIAIAAACGSPDPRGSLCPSNTSARTSGLMQGMALCAGARRGYIV